MGAWRRTAIDGSSAPGILLFSDTVGRGDCILGVPGWLHSHVGVLTELGGMRVLWVLQDRRPDEEGSGFDRASSDERTNIDLGGRRRLQGVGMEVTEVGS